MSGRDPKQPLSGAFAHVLYLDVLSLTQIDKLRLVHFIVYVLPQSKRFKK